MLDYWSKSKKFLYCLGGKIKGSLKTPCFCIGVAAAFLFVLISAGSGLFLKSIAVNSGFYLADISKIFSSQNTTDLFVGFLTTKEFSLESPQFILVENSVLLASTPPTTFSSQVLGSLFANYESEDVREAIVEYIVKEGDNLSSLAEKFNISVDTIRWANNISGSTVKIGQKLVILPVSGIVHHIKAGDTVSEIAATYKADKEEIVAFNALASENDIYIGDIIIVPGGKMPVKKQASGNIPTVSGQFVAPVFSPYIITQGLHWYNAIDFSHAGYACGKSVFAAAGGTVQKTGYDLTAGNYIRILHPNGVVTFYGHLSTIFVSAGQQVSVGERMGLIGNTGYTIGQTGCHLHFEVRGATNPFAK